MSRASPTCPPTSVTVETAPVPRGVQPPLKPCRRVRKVSFGQEGPGEKTRGDADARCPSSPSGGSCARRLGSSVVASEAEGMEAPLPPGPPTGSEWPQTPAGCAQDTGVCFSEKWLLCS